MDSKGPVITFLSEFKYKSKVFGILFKDDRPKNLNTLIQLELSTRQRKEILDKLELVDFVEGPLKESFYAKAEMWVFGKKYKAYELYIKIALGGVNRSNICISFHVAEFPLMYPFKNKKDE